MDLSFPFSFYQVRKADERKRSKDLSSGPCLGNIPIQGILLSLSAPLHSGKTAVPLYPWERSASKRVRRKHQSLGSPCLAAKPLISTSLPMKPPFYFPIFLGESSLQAAAVSYQEPGSHLTPNLRPCAPTSPRPNPYPGPGSFIPRQARSSQCPPLRCAHSQGPRLPRAQCVPHPYCIEIAKVTTGGFFSPQELSFSSPHLTKFDWNTTARLSHLQRVQKKKKSISSPTSLSLAKRSICKPPRRLWDPVQTFPCLRRRLGDHHPARHHPPFLLLCQCREKPPHPSVDAMVWGTPPPLRHKSAAAGVGASRRRGEQLSVAGRGI